MKIYDLVANPDQYDPLTEVNEGEFTLDDHFDGSSRIATWDTLYMQYFSEIEKPVLPKGDYPGFLGVPVFSSIAVDALSDLIRDRGELLPVDVRGESFYIFNVTNLVNCLDYDRSELAYYSDGGLMAVDDYVFNEDKIGDSAIFKLPEFATTYVFVTQAFVDRVNESGLKGFIFQKVYDSDE